MVARDLVFWEALEKYSIEAVESSFKWARENLSFFPTPKDIIEEIEKGKMPNHPREYEPQKIGWMEPTEQGKQLARDCLDYILSHINEKEQAEKKERDQQFEANRIRLKKQAELIRRNHAQ